MLEELVRRYILTGSQLTEGIWDGDVLLTQEHIDKYLDVTSDMVTSACGMDAVTLCLLFYYHSQGDAYTFTWYCGTPYVHVRLDCPGLNRGFFEFCKDFIQKYLKEEEDDADIQP